MDTGVLHGMVIGLTVLIAFAVGLVLARTTRFWLNDDTQLARVESSRLYRGWVPVLIGLVLAAAAAWAFPLHQLVGSGWSAYAPLSGTTFTPPQPNSADRIGTACLLGLAAGTTPFLFTTDIIVRRLPDRIVLPTAIAGLAVIITGSILGASPAWFTAFFAGLAALVLFALLHLLGRVLRRQTMGLGDVKVSFLVFAVAGLYDMWAPALVLVVMMLIAGVWALIGVIRARRVRGVTIAFGPAMLSGMWLGSMFAPIVL
ncbi:prepilin peptidase [Brevibacterium spongiae]|uniref:Prepilin peptidase n=1 Tax=Brevibacterium spongiae TaxID=2909672 RepID=A0ABY5SIY5_9MICO|nr:prepilin peptidase [Brevibacterium spongiae]UVI34512.1 prepilin peptidase [Brevibacterium spongiae]